MVAAALGALLGVLLTLISHRASGFVTPHDPARGVAVYGALMLARMTLSIALLAAFFIAAPDGLVPFGLALGISFIVGLGYEAVRETRLHAPHTSA